MEKKENTFGFYALIIVLALFILGRTFGRFLFVNNWSFNQWQFLPPWYPVVWALMFGLVLFVFVKYFEKLGVFFSRRLNIVIGLVVLFALTFVLRFDSFVYGGGNLKVALLTEPGKIVYNWYDPGTNLILSGLYHFYQMFPLDEIEHYQNFTAAVWAWRTLTYAGTLLSLVGAVLLTREIISDTARRLYLFVLFFFGGQTMLYLGFIGYEPVIVTGTVWFCLLAYKICKNFSISNLLLLWLVTLASVFMHFTALYLIPALFYVTLTAPFKKETKPYLAMTLAVISAVVLIFVTYLTFDNSFPAMRHLFFLDGHRPRLDYGLLSGKHIGDMIQLFFLAVPLAAVVKIAGLTRRGWVKNNPAAMTAWIMATCSSLVVVIIYPVAGIAFDIPRYLAYLTPFSFVAVLFASKLKDKTGSGKNWLAVTAAAALMFPFSYLPVYIKIDPAKQYLQDYLEKNESFYREGIIAFRDALFYRREFTAADWWEWQLPVKSLEYLNLKGCRDLVTRNRNVEALNELYAEIARNPFWSDPREMVVAVQMKLGRYDLAKSQLDTCLMLGPYKKNNLTNLYIYYRDTRNLSRALEVAQHLCDLYPDDSEVKTDLMIINYRLGNFTTADSLAGQLIVQNGELAFPWLIKGFILEDNGQTDEALEFYKKFVKLGPDEVETPEIQAKIDSLEATSPKQK
ncbi:MAG: tetratricopeptide repeat protein [Candidatus Zixiibacteriota bacterium]